MKSLFICYFGSLRNIVQKLFEQKFVKNACQNELFNVKLRQVILSNYSGEAAYKSKKLYPFDIWDGAFLFGGYNVG